ncbi:MAG: long-chain fatty acid--CoA ligase [Deltaproteobacteria bacterium]|nr:long-chain fatty acid--CoA ligase [Deltaproteobacteria bacterium]
MIEKIVLNVGSWIEKWARIHPEKIALISEDVPYSYLDLNRRVNRLSNFFLDMGMEKGDRVAVLLRNCRQYIEIFLALSKTGGILVPLNWRLALPETEFIVRDSSPRFIIFDEEFAGNAAMLRERISVFKEIFCTSGESKRTSEVPDWAIEYESSLMTYPDSSPYTAWESGGEDPHIIMYTSGTTGLPKGAILSHQKTFFNVLNAGIYFDLTSHDIAMIARPLFHSGGLIVEFAPILYRGGTAIVRKRFSAQQILEVVEKERVTILELPATVYNIMLHECDIARYDLTSVKCFFTGGERIPVALLKAYAEKGIIISQIYGLTEVSTIFWLPASRAMEKMGSVGQPAFHGEVRIVDGKGKPVKSGEIGEIAVKGPIVMNGYWKRPDLTRQVMKGGWLHTGDLARFDEDGFAYIVDRKKDMFISGGENVYPAEVEKALFGHPAILDAAVVGVPDDKWGEVGKAFIETKEGHSIAIDEIRSFLDDKLARYKIPQYIEFIKKLPKTASGKIKKNLLK